MRTSLALALLFFTCFFAFRVWQGEQVKRVLKADHVELSHVKYGLFNVDQWKLIATDIVSRKVDEFEITEENREEVIKKTEDMLHEVIDEVEAVLREENKKSLGGFFKQLASDLFVPFDDVRKGIPRYAETIVDRLNDPETKQQLKGLVRERIDAFADETVGTMNYEVYDTVVAHYGAAEAADALSVIEERYAAERREQRKWVIGLAVAVLGLLFLAFTGASSRGERISLTLGALVLLACGVSLPMIDIEATITSFRFLLAGEPVEFSDQVLFFQSKSILEVIGVLLQNGDAPLVVVGFLIFAFSVLLPLAKLTLTLLSHVFGKAPQAKWQRWILYKSGKWSMADVMVVALFMAYIGFTGVINSQLTQIERQSGTLEVFTTNNSTLQLGFYLFTAYALCGVLLSSSLRDSAK